MTEQLGPSTRNRLELVSELGRAFLKTSALRIGDFTTSEGRKTPFYIDLRLMLSFPHAMSLAVECLEYELREITNAPECICGVPLRGLIFASIVAFKHSTPLVYHIGENDHKIAGLIKPGSNVIVIDDVSETGITIDSAAVAIRANGGVVTDALTIIDRSEGANETLSKTGIRLHPFTTTHELAKTLRDNLALSDDEAELVENS